jgi:hypothetical protein
MSKMMAVLDDNNQVTNIILCDDSVENTPLLLTFTQDNPASIGGDYFEGYFYEAQPFPSWSREAGLWLAPTPKPESLGNWQWNEDEQEWQD